VDLHLGHKQEVRITILVTLLVLAIQLHRGINVSKTGSVSMPVPAANAILLRSAAACVICDALHAYASSVYNRSA